MIPILSSDMHFSLFLPFQLRYLDPRSRASRFKHLRPRYPRSHTHTHIRASHTYTRHAGRHDSCRTNDKRCPTFSFPSPSLDPPFLPPLTLAFCLHVHAFYLFRPEKNPGPCLRHDVRFFSFVENEVPEIGKLVTAPRHKSAGRAMSE